MRGSEIRGMLEYSNSATHQNGARESIVAADAIQDLGGAVKFSSNRELHPTRWTIRPFLLAGFLIWLSASAAFGLSYRWSAGSYRIYITGPGTATLSDVKVAMPNAPLTQVAPGVWHLRANLVVENGGKLLIHGTKIGGDVNQLRLQSNNTGESNRSEERRVGKECRS